MTPKTIVIVLPGDDTSERKIVLMIQKNYNYNTHCGNKSSKLLTTRFIISIMNVMEGSIIKLIWKKIIKSNTICH